MTKGRRKAKERRRLRKANGIAIRGAMLGKCVIRKYGKGLVE